MGRRKKMEKLKNTAQKIASELGQSNDDGTGGRKVRG
jgi:hypothetical protein